MHGRGVFILENILRGTTCTVETIRGNPDPLFGGINPEPMMPQLEPLGKRVVTTGSNVGLATDGDADRLGIVDETGIYLTTLQTLSLLLLHVYRNIGWRGAVARTYSQSLLIPRIATSFGLELFERPIGFKNIGELMLEREILIGGEESGGIGLSRHLPERDGIFINLLFLDLLAASGKTCTELIRRHVGRNSVSFTSIAATFIFRFRLEMPWWRSGAPTLLRPLPAGGFVKWVNWMVQRSFSTTTAGFCSANPEPSRCCGFIAKHHGGRQCRS